MARRYDCTPKRIGCVHCACGNHRGCIKRSPPAAFKGGYVPYEYRYRNPEPNCPCIITDDKRLKDLKAEQTRLAKVEKMRLKSVANIANTQEKRLKSVTKAERSLAVRLVAIEKALWGRSYVGLVGTKRPAVNCADFEIGESV